MPTVPAHRLTVGDVLAAGGTITAVLAHDGLGGPVDPPAHAVTVDAEVDYTWRRTWAPTTAVELAEEHAHV